jgi:cardiolipin synthase
MTARMLRVAPLVVALAGCSSLPVLVPDLAQRARATPQLEGAQGPLAPARSRAVLAQLAARGAETNIFERHLAIEEALVGSPLTTGNEVRLLQDGPATYAAMFEAIAAARDHIHLETYILDDDEVGQRFAAALLDRQRAGVQVNLIRDSAGTFATPAAFFAPLIEAGARVLEFNPLNPLAARSTWQWNRRDHRKLLIVDGETAFMGGINISSVYSSAPSARAPAGPADADPPWRDTDLALRGPVVGELQKLFLATWQSQQAEPLAERAWFPPPPAVPVGRQVVRAIGSSPEEPFSLIYATLLSAIGSAETSVYLTNAYFVPDPQLIAALVAASARGVDVRLVLPGRTDSWLVFHAGRGSYAPLLHGGVRIFERRGAILHSKTALIDGVWATVGSTNLDWRSFLHNHELNVVVLGAGFGAELQGMFERDLAASDEITREAWDRRGLDLRAKEWFARLWEYWL